MKPIYVDYDGGLNTMGYFPIDITIPFDGRFLHEATISTIPQLTPADYVDVSWIHTIHFDENTPELCDIGFIAEAQNGQFSLTIFSKDNTKLGGLYKLKYKIN